MDVLFPFGYGLSYTDFTYSNMKVTVNGKNATDVDVIKETDEIIVSADITNTGNCDGAEIVQLYIKILSYMKSVPKRNCATLLKYS